MVQLHMFQNPFEIIWTKLFLLDIIFKFIALLSHAPRKTLYYVAQM